MTQWQLYWRKPFAFLYKQEITFYQNYAILIHWLTIGPLQLHWASTIAEVPHA